MFSLSYITILCAIVCISNVTAAPAVDVNNDTRPIEGVIKPEEEKPIAGDESAVLEIEGIPSKTITLYDQSQIKYADIFNKNAKPIVDNIQEHEKYGNDGDRFFGAGRKLIDSYESLANIVNKIIDSPREIARGFSRSITDKLNEYGGKLVGL